MKHRGIRSILSVLLIGILISVSLFQVQVYAAGGSAPGGSGYNNLTDFFGSMFDWINNEVIIVKNRYLKETLNPFNRLAREGLKMTEVNGTYDGSRQSITSVVVPCIDEEWTDVMFTYRGRDYNTDCSLDYSGFLVPKVTGHYTFILTANDYYEFNLGGSKLMQRLLDPGVTQGITEESVEVDLEANKYYRLALIYKHIVGPGMVKLEWIGPGIERQVIPMEYYKR